MSPMIQWRVTHTAYPAVRRVMGEERQFLDDDRLESMLERAFPDSDPEDIENFMRTVQRFGRQAAPLAQRALPGLVSGAAQGSTVAGPWGAVAGGVIGGVSSLLGGGSPARPATSASPIVPAAPVMPPSARVTPGAVSPGAAGVMLGPGGVAPGAAAEPSAAAAQLLALLSRPETMQALLAMLMSASGRPAIQVGTQQVPPPAFANAIAELAAVAALDGAFTGDAAEHLFDSDQHPRGDIVNPAARAAILLSDLAAVAAQERADEEQDEEEEYADGWQGAFDVEEQDAIDAYEHTAYGWNGNG